MARGLVMARSTKKHRPIRLSVSSRRLMVLTLGLGVLAGASCISTRRDGARHHRLTGRPLLILGDLILPDL